MPAPERTTTVAIVDAARALLEDGGPAAITMQAVAARVGVRAPSLYKRVRDRDALLELVAESVADELTARLAASAPALRDFGHAYRAFGRETPEGFRLLLATSGAAGQRVSEPLLRVAADTVGRERALDAARLLTAWATGFILMELGESFQLGGDVDEAFEYGLDRIVAGLDAGRASGHG